MLIIDNAGNISVLGQGGNIGSLVSQVPELELEAGTVRQVKYSGSTDVLLIVRGSGEPHILSNPRIS